MRITRAVPSVVRSLLYRFLKVPSSLRLTSARRGARASLNRHPPGAAGAVAGLGLRERAAQSNLNRRARPTRGHRRSLSLPPALVTREVGASCVHAACDTRDSIPPSSSTSRLVWSREAVYARGSGFSRARARER